MNNLRKNLGPFVKSVYIDTLINNYEIIEKDVPWILDVAHNANAAKNFLQRLESLKLGNNNIMILSLMKDKNTV